MAVPNLPVSADPPAPARRRWLRRAALGVAALAAGAALFRGGAQRHTRAAQAIDPAIGIDSLEEVTLGGVPQWIHLRGYRRASPLLVWIHGGPGFPQMPFARFNDDLARSFVVVQWDMRGAGKSYRWGMAADEMRLGRLGADAHELVEALLRRFGRSKCLLFAHSFGTIIGAREVARHPELYLAYVGAGQIVNVPRMQTIRYDFALDAARRENNAAAVADLQRIGPPPHLDLRVCSVMEKWIRHYASREHPGVPSGRFVGLALASPEYSWTDLLQIPVGFTFSFEALWRETFYDVDLFQEITRMEVPVCLLSGRFDRVAPPALAQQWLDGLDSRAGKKIIPFESSAHWTFLEEPEHFHAALKGQLVTSGTEDAGRSTNPGSPSE